MAAELATAYFSLLPSMKGTAAIVNAELAGVSALGAGAGGRMGTAMSGGLVATFSKAIPIVGGILAGLTAGLGIADLFSESVDLASDLNESANAVRVTFGALAGEVDDLGKTAADRIGLSQNAFNALATRFSSFATTIAGDGGDVVKVLDDLTTRGADFASVFNLNVDDALTLFQSGLAGETEPLRRFGIDMSAARVEAFAYANGIGTVGTELTEAEKVQARYGLLMEQTNRTQGDFKNTSDELANSQRILAAKMEDAKAKLGTALLPALTEVTQLLLVKGVPLFEKLVDLFIKFEPLITAQVDAWLLEATVVADLTSVFLDFFAVISDGKITAAELTNSIANLPKPLQGLIVGFVNFVRGIVNPAIDAANSIGRAFTNAVNAVSAFTGVRISWSGIASIPGSVKQTQSRLPGGNNTNYGYATGGMFSARPGGHQITVGEGRYNEAVLPLRPDVLKEIGQGIGGGGGLTELGPNTMQALIDAFHANKNLFTNDQVIASSAGRGSAFSQALGAA